MVYGMSTMEEVITIDGAGRVVIPSALRRRLQLRAGTKLKADVEGERLVLEPIQDGDAVADEDGLLVATGTLEGAWIDHRDLRAERGRKLTGG
jgi:AbrB family looped-hinge helix DNA binding protein